MNSIIKIESTIVDEIVKHCNINPYLECGGYLYGTRTVSYGNQIFLIDGIYYEKIFGTEDKFTFSPLYNFRAEYYGMTSGNEIIGCYHSHGKYKAQFSGTDRKLELYYASNKVALIYSPSENKLIGDIITDSNIYESRCTITNSKKLKRIHYPKLSSKPRKIISLAKFR